MWHNHSTILQTGYVLFAVWIVYDQAVFYAQAEWTQKQTRQSRANIQSLVEEPTIYTNAPSSSSPADQLALVGDRLQELPQPVMVQTSVIAYDSFAATNPHNNLREGHKLEARTSVGGVVAEMP